MTKQKVAAYILALACFTAHTASAAEGDAINPDTPATTASPATTPAAPQPAISPSVSPAATSGNMRHTAVPATTVTAASGTASTTTIKTQPQTPLKKPDTVSPVSGVRTSTPASVNSAAPQVSTPKPVTPAKPAATLPVNPPATTVPAPKPDSILTTKSTATPVPAPKPAAAMPVKPPVIPSPVTKQTPPAAAPTPASTDSSSSILKQAADIEMFIREGCDNCANAKEFLDKLQALQPQLKINIRDVRKEPAALELLKRLAQNQEVATLDYPAFVVSGQLIIGFSDKANTAQNILDNLPLLHGTSEDDEACADSKTPGCGLIPAPPPSRQEHITLNFFGYNIQLSHIGMPLFTIAAGLLDGLNFGSTWVLVLMLSLLAPFKDRSRMLSITGTFLLVQALFFFLVMVVWFNLVASISAIRPIQMVFAIIAIVASAAYFWKYLVFGQRLSISTPEIDKPGIYTYIRKIIETETFLATLLGAMALSVFVLLTEFSVKSVFPLLYAKVLAMQNLGTLASYGYLVLYDLSYMLDDFIILAIGIATLKQERTIERKDNRLNLLSSLLLLATAAYLFLIKLH